MERLLGQMPPLSTLLDYPTIRSLAGRLEQLGAIAGNRLFLPVRARGRRAPLFYAHAAFVNVLFARKLLPYLHAEQPVYAIQARGLHEGEKPHQTFASMAADYVDLIRRVQPKGPYFLAGHCVGGLVAYEMAQHLKALGEDVAAVVMVDPEYHPNAVPWLHWRNPSALHVRLWRTFIRPIWFAHRWLRRIWGMLTGQPLPGLASETGANRQRQKAVMAGLKAALKAYRPRPYAGKLYILCSVERRKHLTNPATGWSSLAAEVEFVESGVSHEEVFIAAFPVVGAMIERILDAAQPAILAPIDRSAAE
jgi:thioesterase domain-containing protein